MARLSRRFDRAYTLSGSVYARVHEGHACVHPLVSPRSVLTLVGIMRPAKNLFAPRSSNTNSRRFNNKFTTERALIASRVHALPRKIPGNPISLAKTLTDSRTRHRLLSRGPVTHRLSLRSPRRYCPPLSSTIYQRRGSRSPDSRRVIV